MLTSSFLRLSLGFPNILIVSCFEDPDADVRRWAIWANDGGCAADKIRDEGPRHDGPTNAFLLEANARPTSLLTLSPPSFRQRVEIVATRFRS